MNLAVVLLIGVLLAWPRPTQAVLVEYFETPAGQGAVVTVGPDEQEFLEPPYRDRVGAGALCLAYQDGKEIRFPVTALVLFTPVEGGPRVMIGEQTVTDCDDFSHPDTREDPSPSRTRHY